MKYNFVWRDYEKLWEIPDFADEYLLKMTQFSVLGNPTEYYDAYGLITEAFILHKQPHDRYIIFPQLFIPWNPKKTTDTRGDYRPEWPRRDIA